LELVWVDDAVDAFFLHIQGSGRIILRDGSVLRIGFAGSNGHPYTAIGKLLVARGAIEREHVSMQSIRAWLGAHPAKARDIMAANARYIFFRVRPGAGPIGAHGAALTAGRSIAVDRRALPLGAPLWLDTSYPAADSQMPGRPLRRLMVAQDTGAAITGAVRGDVFWGHGETAARRAGHMQQRGRYFLLLPKDVRVPGG
jgi:membrane-bound lytic murein transglycosylase A